MNTLILFATFAVVAVAAFVYTTTTDQTPVDTQPQSVAELVLESIREQHQGNATLFGVCGAAWYPFDKVLSDAVDANQATFVHTTSESVACIAASHWRGSGVGVAITTAGPGTTMAVTGIASATKEEQPLVCICGVPAEEDAYGFQFVDPAMVDPICKYRFHIRSNDAVDVKAIMRRAFSIATNGTRSDPGPGAVVVFLNVDNWLKRLPRNIAATPMINASGLTGSEERAARNIIQAWNRPIASSIVLRIGQRVDPDVASKWAGLLDDFPQLYITLTYGARGYLGPNIHARMLDLDGPLGNSVANECVHDANLVIEAGVGVTYNLLVNETHATMTSSRRVIRLYDDARRSGSSHVNVDQVLNLLYQQRSFLRAAPNTTVAQWTSMQSNTAFADIITQYKAQSGLTTGKAVATCVTELFDDPNDIGGLVNTFGYDNICDVGAAGFIAGQLTRVTHYSDLITFSQFSPIGAALSAAVGRVHSDAKDTVIYIGDGGLLNMSSSLVDLANACHTQNVRCLVLVFNDTRYGNVALGEKALFGAFTDITSTASLQQHVSIGDLLNAMQPVQYSTVFDMTFVQSFRDQAVGWTDPGLYVLNMTVVTGDFVKV